jgi:ABC-type transport system substrate-binding protein
MRKDKGEGERKMNKKPIFAILAIAMMTMMLIPAQAFIFPDCHSDPSFEMFGPRAEVLLIHLYADDTAEFTAMSKGQIDMCDWPLSKTVYTQYSSYPYNQTIKIVNYGAEYGLYIIDMNCNNNTYMGNPPDPLNGNNPMVTATHGNWMSDVSLRRAIDYLINRPALIANPSIGAGFGYPLYTTIPPPLGKYLLDITTTNATWAYTYSRLLANETLENDTYIEGPTWGPSSGVAGHVARFYIDVNDYATLKNAKAASSYTATLNAGQGAKFHVGDYVYIIDALAVHSTPPYLSNPDGTQAGEWHTVKSIAGDVLTFDQPDVSAHAAGARVYVGQLVTIMFYIRSDHPGRKWIGETLTTEMEMCNLKVDPIEENSGACYVDVMVNKNFHLYTGGWSLSAQPDYLILWDWAYYWHPGFCYDYGGCNDALFNYAADGIMAANSQAEAVAMALLAQFRQAYMVLGAPVYCVSGNKAYWRWNTGGNAWDETDGAPGGGAAKPQDWLGVVNIMGYGIDNGWSFMDMHTNVTEWETSMTPPVTGMTIDYGFKVPELKDVNILYASWLWDTNVLGEIYDSLLTSNASNIAQLMPWIATNWTVSTYTNPVLGTCSKVRFTLDPNAVWSDGTPLTLADVYYSFIEVKADLAAKGHPPPWWWSNVEHILSFSILDPYNFEVLLDLKSYWALYWIAGSYIIPKHIWKPIILTGSPESTFADPKVIGSGPWKFYSYTEGLDVVLVRNPLFHHIGPISCKLIVNSNNLNKFTPAEGLNPSWLVLDCRFDPTMPYHQYVDMINYTITIAFRNSTYGFGDPPHDTSKDFIVAQGSGITIPAGGVLYIPFPIVFPDGERGWRYGDFEIEWLVWWNCKWPPWAEKDNETYGTGYWYKQYCEMEVYCTIKEDVAGSTLYDDIEWATYPYKTELPSPDKKVNLKDIFAIALAFGSFPGSKTWNVVCDINHDYKVDLKDYFAAAIKFGWQA